MKNVLLIAYYYPPMGGIGTQRSQKFARYLGEYGWQPIVVAPERGSYYVDSSLDDLTTRNVEVIRTRAIDLSSILKGLIPGAKASEKPLADNHNTTGNSILGILRRAVNTWVYIPDGQIGWYPYAVRAGKRALESHDVAAIWSTSFPVTAHLVAHRLKLASNRPWIADFRDLWTQNHYADYSSSMRKRIDQVVESNLLDEMDIIVTVSDVWADELRRLTGGRKRVEVIRNGFDSSEFEGVKSTARDKWVITYVGLFYGDKQDPTPFLSALRRVIASGRIARQDVQFNIVGQPDSFVEELIAQFGLGDVTHFSGLVSHAEALAYQVNSSLLLLIIHGDRTNPGHVPGKLYEYLGSGKPILGILPPDFEAARIIQGAGAGMVIEGSAIEAIERYLLSSYAAFKSGTDIHPVAADLSAYERKAGARKLAGLLNELTAAPFSAI